MSKEKEIIKQLVLALEDITFTSSHDSCIYTAYNECTDLTLMVKPALDAGRAYLQHS